MMKNKNGEPVLGLTFWGLYTLKGVGYGVEIGKISIGGRRDVGAQRRHVTWALSSRVLRVGREDEDTSTHILT